MAAEYFSHKGSLWEERGLNSRMGFLTQSKESERGVHNTSGYEKSAEILSTRERQESAVDTGTLLKDQLTKSNLQPLTLGSDAERAEQTTLM